MIIAAMTTWRPRLMNVPEVIYSIMSQTLRPDKIVLTLSCEEFPEGDPLGLDDRYVEIMWTRFNTKVWKKLNPVMDIYPDAELINIDDDVLYPTQFIESLHEAYASTHRPVTVNDTLYRGLYTHAGYASLVTSRMFQGVRPTFDVMENVKASDLWYTFVTNMHGFRYVSCPRAAEGRQLLPQPEKYTTSTDVNPEWEWLQRYYTK